MPERQGTARGGPESRSRAVRPGRTPRPRPAPDDDGDGDQDRAAPTRQLPLGAVELPGSPGVMYGEGGLYRITKDGVDRILDWLPEVIERGVIAADSGEPARRYYVVRVGPDEATVLHAELRSGEVWDQFPDAVGVGTRAVRDMLANVVQSLGRQLPRTIALERTGWHELDGRRAYVFEDGRTIPAGPRARVIGDLGSGRAAAAAAPPAAWSSAAEVADALRAMSGHGWGPLLGVAAGVRALGQSLHQVPAGLALVGPRGRGKDSSAWAAIAVRISTPWPPIPISTFGATPTAIEVAADRARDQIGLIDDLAITLDSPAIEQRVARDKLEAVFRPLFNDTTVRPRRRRDTSFAQRDNRIQCYPVITAQRLPDTIQESLYRRFIAVHFERGASDVLWYGHRDDDGKFVNSAALVTPLRTIGQRVIERLAEADDPARLLARNDAEALRQLVPFIDAEIPGWADRDDCLREVVRCAAALMGGLALAADVAQLPDRWAVARVIAPDLARALARQAEIMTDQASATDDLGTAVGEVIAAGLLGSRAHVRSRAGDLAPAVPGRTEQEQGLEQAGGMSGGWRGRGIPMWWLPDLGPAGVLGVESGALHQLLRQSGDIRVQGKTPRSLPDALMKSGAIVPSDQKGRAATHRVRFGAEALRRLLLVRPEVIWPGCADAYEGTEKKNGNNGNNGNSAGQEPASGSCAEGGAENGNIAGQGPAEAPGEVPAELAGNAVTCAVPDVPDLCPDCRGSVLLHDAECPSLPPLPADPGEPPPDLPADLVMSLAGRTVPAVACPGCGQLAPATVAVGGFHPGCAPAEDQAHEADHTRPAGGPPPAPERPQNGARRPARPSGAGRPARPASGPEGEAQAARDADELDEWTREVASIWPGASAADTAAALDVFHAAYGLRFIRSASWTGVTALRRDVALFGSKQAPTARTLPVLAEIREAGPLRHLAFTVPGRPVRPGMHFTAWDINGQHPAAAGSTLLGTGDPELVTRPRSIAPFLSMPGYVQAAERVRTGHPAYGVIAAGEWVTMPHAKFIAASLGAEIPAAAVVFWGRGNASKHLATFTARYRKAREQLAGRDDRPAAIARAVLKRVANNTIGMLRSDDHNRTEFLTHDWYDQVVASAEANVLRHLARIEAAGGGLPFGKCADGAWWVSKTEREHPAGLEASAQLGKWKLEKWGLVTDEIAAAYKAKSAAQLQHLIKAADTERRAGQ